MSLRRIALLAFPVLTVAAAACFSDPVYPGDQVLGTFRFDATIDWARTTCKPGGETVQLGDGGTLRFEGTFSRNADAGAGYLTVQGFSRDAGYEGQRVVSLHRVGAALPGCGTNCEGSQIEESLDVLLLSSSQDEAVGRRCSGLVDGGVPGSEDGGTQPPGPTPNGYDVQRACGTLTDDFIPGTKNCTCTKPCRAVYTVEGTRVD
ncbi:MAG: hypothetical protein JXB05_22970 [Myxococcaceae bacterium]|nr:hypothetical protein [Myxococcaceae bacterium]